jgi:tyrosyl-DNA phosphodiesterase-1
MENDNIIIISDSEEDSTPDTKNVVESIQDTSIMIRVRTPSGQVRVEVSQKASGSELVSLIAKAFGYKSSTFKISRQQSGKEEIKSTLNVSSLGLKHGDLLFITLDETMVQTSGNSSEDTSKKRDRSMIEKSMIGSLLKRVSIQMYTKGRLVMTKSPGSESQFDIKDLIKPGLAKAFLSSFCINDEFLDSILPSNISTIIACPRPSNITDQSKVTVSENRMYIFPKIEGYGSMHIKLFIFWYKDFVRIVIPSANLVPYDWELIENSVFYQDFEKLPSPSSCDNEYIWQLKDLLLRMGCPKVMIDNLDGYDYSKAIGKLVVSAPGWHENLEKFGQGRLKNVVKALNLDLTNATVSCQTSSMGSLVQRWGFNFYNCCLGVINFSKNISIPANRFSIMFPSKRTVTNSSLGPRNGGTICFSSKYWLKTSFPKHLIKDLKARSNGLMHSKLMVCSRTSNVESKIDIHRKEEFDGYIYQGSHNATQSAWGDFTLKLPIRLSFMFLM